MRRLIVGMLCLALVACGSEEAEPVIDPGDGGDYSVQIDPAAFGATIDNPWLPLTVGSRWVYEGTEDGEVERIEVVVTDQTRMVMGVAATQVNNRFTLLAQDPRLFPQGEGRRRLYRSG